MADNENDSFLDKYVGEGKKYATVEDLAKAYDHANSHIEEMKNDNGHLREEFEMFREFTTAQLAKGTDKNASGKENLSDDNKGQNELSPEPKPAPAPPNGKVEEVDLDARIAKALEEKDEQKRLEANARIAEEVMVKHFGSKEEGAAAIRKRAEELGVSPNWLASTAFQSPKAFFVSMNINPDETPRSTSTPNASSDVNAQRLADANPAIKPGTYAFYQKLRKDNPREYWSFDVQKRFMEDALRMGPDFYKN